MIFGLNIYKKILCLILINFICLLSFTQTKTCIPDNNFESYLEANGMGDGILSNDSVSTVNIVTVNTLDVGSENIADLTGIEDFLALTILYCENNQLDSLNVTQNIALEELGCEYNQIKELDLSLNVVLRYLLCDSNSLTRLNIANGNNLNLDLYASNNQNLYCVVADDPNWASSNWTVTNSSIDSQTSFNNFYPNLSAGFDLIICYRDSIILSGISSENLTYNWDNGVINNTYFIPDSTTLYIVTGSDSISCASTDTILVSVNIPVLANDTIIGCDSAIWNGNSFTVSGNYTDTLQAINGCDSIVTLNIIINSNPTANAGSDLDTCLGTILILNGSGAGVGGVYQWSPINSVNHFNDPNPITVLDSNIQFFLEVTDSNGCLDSDSVQYNVFSSSKLRDSSLCKGDSLLFNLYVDSLFNPTFSWFPTTGVISPNESNTYICPDTTTKYSYFATASNGCTISDTISLDVSIATSILDTTVLSNCQGVSVVFENISDEDLNFYWNINSTDSILDKIYQIQYEFDSKVQAALYVGNSFGCLDSSFIELDLGNFDKLFKVSLPNVFTPNFDGDNDIFKIDIAGKLNECSELSIFNRWGQLVYSSKGIKPEWNGKNYAGIDVPTGQYFFKLLIKEELFDGKLYLFR